MNTDQLHQSLRELHDELGKIDTVDEQTQAVLRDLAQDIQTLLARARVVPVREDQPLHERLRNGVSYFEATHPQLSNTIDRVLSALVQLGV